MATPASDGGRAADQQRRAQRALSRRLVREVRGLRRLIQSTRIQSSLPMWMAAVRALVESYGAAAAALSADFYETQREAAGAPGRFVPQVADGLPGEQLEASLRWAAKDVWPRDPGDPRTTEAQRQPVSTRVAVAERRAEGVAQKLVLDQGRETIRQAVRQDRGAVAFARAASLGACSFCKLMASRGAVYKTSGTAGRDADERFAGDASVVKFHDYCHCGIIPVFRGQRFELSDHAREWDRLYQEYAAGHSGEQLARFRQALREHDSNPLPAAH